MKLWQVIVLRTIHIDNKKVRHETVFVCFCFFLF